MIGVILVLLTVLYFIYKYYEDQRQYWSKRKIPGPTPELLFGNFRDIWDYERPRSIVLRDWTKQYGRTYGIHEGQRKVLVTSDFDFTNEILVKKFDHFHARISFPLHRPEDGPKTHMVEAQGAHWKRLRALGSFAFTNKALKQICPRIEASAFTMLEAMEKHCDGELNILDYFQEFTMDVIAKVALGKSDVKMFHNPYVQICRDVFNRAPKSVVTALPTLFPFTNAPWFYLFEYIGKFFQIPFLKLMAELEETVANRKKQREAGLESSGDFIDMFLDAEVDDSEVEFGADAGHKPTFSRKLLFDEIVSQCMVFLLAGFETTSNSLSYAVHFLANHPDVQAKMIEEIDAVCHDEVIEYDQLAQLKYTECVVKESLRHYPVASFVVARECVKPAEVCGHKFEVGDLIQTDTWSLHMDTQLWGEDAAEFRPERWLESSGRARTAFQAFGEGPRMCIGMRLAYMEEKVALVHLLKKFTIKTSLHTNPLHLVGGFTVCPREVMVKLEKRLRP